MEMKQKNTKDKILYLLKKEGSLTVNDLTDRLDITHMAVRKHLIILEKDGLIFSVEVRQPMGRPLQVYSLTELAEKKFPKHYYGMTIEFLHDIRDLYGDESIHHLFNKREQRLITEYNTRLKNMNHFDKMKEMTKIQNEKGYMADLSQLDERTFELTEYNCPILNVAKEFNIACKCETDMLKTVLGTEQIKRTCCRTEDDLHCKFIVKF